MNCRSYAYLIAGLLALPMRVLADPPDAYPFLSFDRAMAQSRSDGKLLFVYFGRYGCGYCEKTNKEAFVDPEVKERYTSHYVLAYVDAESGRRTLDIRHAFGRDNAAGREDGFSPPRFIGPP